MNLQIGAGGTCGVLPPGNVTINNSSASLVFNRSDSVTFGGIASGTGSLVQAGPGTLTLTNSGNSYTGGTFVSAGTLMLSTESANQIPTGGNVTVYGGATFDIGSPSYFSNSSSPVGTITLNGGTLRAEAGSYYANNLVMAGGLLSLPQGMAYQGSLFLSNGVTINASATTAVWTQGADSFTSVSDVYSGPETITVAGGTTASGIDIDSSVGLVGTWTKAGPGVMRLTSVLNNVLFLTVAAGKLRVDDVNVLNNLNGAYDSIPLTLNGGALQYGGPTVTDGAGRLTLGGNNGTVEVMIAATMLTLADAISGAGSLTKTGPGTLILINANNSFLGGVNVNNGTLSVAADHLLAHARACDDWAVGQPAVHRQHRHGPHVQHV